MTSRDVKIAEQPQSIPETVHLRLEGNIRGLFAMIAPSGRAIAESDWHQAVSSQLPALIENPSQIFKSDINSKVIMGHLGIGGVEMPVVVKIYGACNGIFSWLGGLFRAKAFRNFKASVRLLKCGIGVAYPQAALRGNPDSWVRGGVFVTGYVDGSVDLDAFVRANISGNGSGGSGDFRLKRHLAGEIGRIFAMIDNGGLWHRDAKAGNFLVCPHSVKVAECAAGFDVILVDLDGIRRKILKGRGSSFRGMSKLASTLLWHGGISTSDYLRAFTIYSNLTGLDKSRRRDVFRELARRAVALRLLTLARSAIEQTN